VITQAEASRRHRADVDADDFAARLYRADLVTPVIRPCQPCRCPYLATAADLVALCRTRTLELGIWQRECLTLRHYQYS
jgi:hypothetical protein